jgi:hypothetical protein
MFLRAMHFMIAAGLVEYNGGVRQSGSSCTYDVMHSSGQAIGPPAYAAQTVASVTMNNQPAFNIDGAHLSSNPCSAVGAIKQLRGLSNDDHIMCGSNGCPELNVGNPT